MFAQSRKNALLNAYFVARVRSLAKISVNNTFVPISEKYAENGFAGLLIVWSIKGKRSFRESPIALFRALSQSANGLSHRSVA
jgi:hypothetical protein